MKEIKHEFYNAYRARNVCHTISSGKIKGDYIEIEVSQKIEHRSYISLLGMHMATKENILFFSKLRKISIKARKCKIKNLEKEINAFDKKKECILLMPYAIRLMLEKRGITYYYGESHLYSAFDRWITLSRLCKDNEIIVINVTRSYILHYPRKEFFQFKNNILTVRHCVEIIPKQYMNKGEFKIIQVEA